MLSSVRRGIADARDSAAALLEALDYEVIRFETVTREPVPPRQTCVDMVKRSDLYLLLLGEEYGDPVPGTNVAPTEEEWSVARAQGKPMVVFEHVGGQPEPLQRAFISRVKDYETGVWRYTFTSSADLIRQLKGALQLAAEASVEVAPQRLDTTITVPWLNDRRGSYGSGSPTLETHAVPTAPMPQLQASSYPELTRTLINTGREHGVFAFGQAVEQQADEVAVTVQASRSGRQPDAGIRVQRDSAATVWESLPSSGFGTALDESQLMTRLARDLLLVATLPVHGTDLVAIAIGLSNVSLLGIPNGTGMSLPFAGFADQPVHLEPTDAWLRRALAGGAADIARELIARLVLRLNSRTR
jgi:hypothetical protein